MDGRRIVGWGKTARADVKFHPEPNADRKMRTERWRGWIGGSGGRLKRENSKTMKGGDF